MIKTKGAPSASQDGKHEFIRDRIARRKEAEDCELGQEDNDNIEAQPDELSALTAEDVSEMKWYRESYLLTLCEDDDDVLTEGRNDSFDVSQLETGRFESFAEVSTFVC